MPKIVVGNRLVWFKDRADKGEFWDQHWAEKVDMARELNKARKGLSGINKKIFRKWVNRELPVLEGGCGIGNVVMSLHSEGYNVVGVDFSKKTINKAKEISPDLNVMHGNIFELDFPDDYFGTYISLGVVEHFWEGPEKALKEAFRVIKKGGVLICSVPYFSPVRKLNALLRRYPSPGKIDENSFYQYAFKKDEFTAFLEGSGFLVIRSYCYAPMLGARKELPDFDSLYRSLPSIVQKCLNRIDLGGAILGHMMFLVAVKK